MDRSASQCTSESGWTLYLDPSTTSTLYQNQQHQHDHGDYRARGSLKTVYDQEEGMSMVSDASSGPPNCHEDYDQDSFYGNGCHQYCSASASDLAHSKKMKKSKSTDQSVTKQRRSCLEDTASSHVFSFSKKNMDFSNKKPSMEHVSSEGFSATHFKVKSTLQKHFGFFKAEK